MPHSVVSTLGVAHLFFFLFVDTFCEARAYLLLLLLVFLFFVCCWTEETRFVAVRAFFTNKTIKFPLKMCLSQRIILCLTCIPIPQYRINFLYDITLKVNEIIYKLNVLNEPSIFEARPSELIKTV